MSFIRAEARAAFWRWREVLIGSALLLLGLYWAQGPGGLLGWLGWALCLVALALTVAGVQRARFRGPGDGPGIVQVDEGQVTYFGPLSGGMVPVSAIRRVILDPTGKPAHWVLERSGQDPLFIPVTADGADALFDAFASLPGMRIQDALKALEAQGRTVVWQHPSTPPVQAITGA